ncbi:hypothetical protein [Microbacterium sp. NPDC055521]
MGEHDPGSATAGGLTRRARRGRDADPREAGAAAALSEEDPLDEHTVVIDRGDVHERTVVIDRGDADERTVVIDRRAPAHAAPEGSGTDPSTADTVIVRSRHPHSEADLSTVDTVAAPPRRSPTETTPAIYKPRPAPIVPRRPPAIVGGAAPTRDSGAVRASVVRRDRRTGLIAVTAVVVSCVVSVAGLGGLALALLG